MLLGYVYKLKPNSQQSARMDSWLNLLRSNYNWSLADRINTYEQRLIQGDYCDVRTKSVACPLTCCVTKGGATGEPWRDNGGRRSAGEIQITALPQLKEARPWYKDVDSTVFQQNIKRLDRAYENFFREGRGYPKFKNRSTFGSFTFTTGVKVKGNKIYLPKLGWMRFYNSRSIPEGFKIKSVTVRKKVSGWFVSIRIEASIPSFPVRSNEEIKTVVGLDLGLTKLVHCSDGSTVSNPRFATNKKTRRLLSRRQRRVSRSKRGKNNRAKAQRKLASLQHKIATQREAHQWQTAKKIVNKADAIALFRP